MENRPIKKSFKKFLEVFDLHCILDISEHKQKYSISIKIGVKGKVFVKLTTLFVTNKKL